MKNNNCSQDPKPLELLKEVHPDIPGAFEVTDEVVNLLRVLLCLALYDDCDDGGDDSSEHRATITA